MAVSANGHTDAAAAHLLLLVDGQSIHRPREEGEGAHGAVLRIEQQGCGPLLTKGRAHLQIEWLAV